MANSNTEYIVRIINTQGDSDVISSYHIYSVINFIGISRQIFTALHYTECLLPHNIVIVLCPQIPVTPLHPMY